jgi:hypothetical protein
MATYLIERWKERAAPIPQDVWSKSREEFPYFDEILKHDFKDMVVVFGINHAYNSDKTDIKYEILSQEYDHILLGDYTLKGNVNIAKEIVGNIINHYALPDTSPRDERYIDGYLGQQVELHNEEVIEENNKYDPENDPDAIPVIQQSNEKENSMSDEDEIERRENYIKAILKADPDANYDRLTEESDAGLRDWFKKVKKPGQSIHQEKNEKENIMSDKLEKILDWSKDLGEQSEFIKKAIEPILTWELAYKKECLYVEKEDRKNFWKTKNEEDPNFVKEHILKNFNVGNLFVSMDLKNHWNNDRPIIEVLKSIGIEGEFSKNGITFYDDKYLKSLDKDYFDRELAKYDYKDDPEEWEGYDGDPEDKDYIIKERKLAHRVRQVETAQKTGYVQGVCESVLAFNNDENRKIMSEATMTFLSKKLLSEMNVTKDMAQKFANPETYKALEQSVFVPKQEQQLEQTQSQGRGL